MKNKNKLIQEIQHNFHTDIRVAKLDVVLILLAELIAAMVDEEGLKRVYTLYMGLIKWALKDKHLGIAHILLWHGRDLIMAFGTPTEKDMLEPMTERNKGSACEEGQKYKIQGLVYDRLAAYALKLTRDIKQVTADVKNCNVPRSEWNMKLDGLCKNINFIARIPVFNGNPIIKTTVALRGDRTTIRISADILKFMYVKVRLFEAAAEAFYVIDRQASSRVLKADVTAEKAASKFRSVMNGLKIQLDRCFRHAEEDKEALTLCLNSDLITNEYGLSTDALLFDFATACGYSEKTFWDFSNVYPKRRTYELSGTSSYQATAPENPQISWKDVCLRRINPRIVV